MAGMDGRYKGGGLGGRAAPPICKRNDLHNPPLLIINYYQHNYVFRHVQKERNR